jgi:serine/threonine protein kinase
MSDSVETDWTDRQIAGYRVLHRLGRGGMSDVYLAFHEKLRRHVALKVLRSSLTPSPEHRERFLREAQAAAGLIHPNIVQVFDVGSLGQTDFIVQEYIAGCNLSTYLKRRGPLPSEEAVSILMQAAAALTRSARQGIVHRDIKPENILLTADGEAKVADFGLARGGEQENNLTEIGVTLGTPLYMSPEQIQGLAVDTRSDLYSLGVTAFHMLAGRPPFEATRRCNWRCSICRSPRPPSNRSVPTCRPNCAAWCTRCLRKIPRRGSRHPRSSSSVCSDSSTDLPIRQTSPTLQAPGRSGFPWRHRATTECR